MSDVNTLVVVVVVPTIAAVFALDSLRKRRRLRELAKGQRDARQREAWELWQQGRYAEVAEVYQKIVRSVEDELGPVHAELVKHLACLGDALAKCGRVADGTALLHRALAIAERATSAPDLAAGPLLSLGGLAFEERQFRRAGDLYQRARAAAATDPRLRAIAEESLGIVAERLGQPAEAERWYAAALDTTEGEANRLDPAPPAHRSPYRVAFLERAPDTDEDRIRKRASLLRAIGDVRAKQRAFARAEEAYRVAVLLLERHFGARDLGLLEGLNGLAGVLVQADRPKEAEPVARRAVDLVEAPHPSSFESHESPADRSRRWSAQHGLAMVLQEAGDWAAARSLLVQLVEEVGVFPDLGAQLRAFSLDCAGCFLLTSEIDEAERVLTRALASPKGGSENADWERRVFAGLHNTRAWVLSELGRLEEAERSIDHALDLAGFDPLADEDDGATANMLDTKAEVVRRAGRLGEARGLVERALRGVVVEGEPDGLGAGLIRNTRAKVLRDEGLVEEAAAEHARALATVERARGREHPLCRRLVEEVAGPFDVNGPPSYVHARR